MGTTVSAEEVKKTKLPKKDIIVGPGKIFLDEKSANYEAAKKRMERLTGVDNAKLEEGIMSELRECMSHSKYSCYSPNYPMYQQTIDKLRSVGYIVDCRESSDPFAQSCTICWER